MFSLLVFGRFGATARAWGLVPLVIALALIVVLDLRARIIPDVLTLPGLAYALALAATLGDPPLGHAALGALVGGAALLLLAVVSRGGVGGGDIKLVAMLGAALGGKAALLVFALSQIGAALVVLGMLLVRRGAARRPFPVGALIALLGALALVAKP